VLWGWRLTVMATGAPISPTTSPSSQTLHIRYAAGGVETLAVPEVGDDAGARPVAAPAAVWYARLLGLQTTATCARDIPMATVRNKYTCVSSEVYPLVARDLAARVGGVPVSEHLAQTVVLRLGEPGVCEDGVVRGGGRVRAAVAEGVPSVPVRVAFCGYRPGLVRWGWHLIHALRRRTTRMGTGIYHVDPRELRRMGLEILVRHEANAYLAISRTRMPAGEERAYWGRLKESIRTHGFKDEFPIVVLLRRTAGLRDRLLQGHHRLAIAIELGLPVVPVSFAYAGHAPRFLTVVHDWLRARRRAGYCGQQRAVR
jgi:hypothetical protein